MVSVKPGQKIGNFIYAGKAKYLWPGCYKKDAFICVCGNGGEFSIHKVLAGRQKSCLQCSLKPSEWWAEQKWGRLRVADANFMTRFSYNSEHKAKFICDCGRTSEKKICLVTDGLTKSCGNCRLIIQSWWKTYFPMDPALGWQLPDGGIVALEPIQNGSTPFGAMCPVCGQTYHPRLSDIKRGLSLTCGCASNRISSAVSEITEFLSRHVSDVETEFRLNGLKYDIGIESKRLVVEFNGLHWHSMQGSKEKDLRKFHTARELGWEIICLFEDEWKQRREATESLLLSRIGAQRPVSLRPSQCFLGSIGRSQRKEFLEKYHYLGDSEGIALGAVHEGRVVSVMVTRRSTRPRAHAWELCRMASMSSVRVHGIWSSLFKKYIYEHQPDSVVSFSDDRLFTGRVYEHLGFIRDGQVSPDYYWTKGNRRFHKSALRKRPGEVGSETELRTAQGFRKIWDMGKTRWVWTDLSSSVKPPIGVQPVNGNTATMQLTNRVDNATR